MSLDMKYFVLKPRAKSATDQYAAAAQEAMLAYAYKIAETDQELADSLSCWANDEARKQYSL